MGVAVWEGRLDCAEPGPKPAAGVDLLLLPGASRDTTDLSYRLDWLDSNRDCPSRDLTLLTGDVKPQRNRRPASRKGPNETAGPLPLWWETQTPAPFLGREPAVTGISHPPACAPPLIKVEQRCLKTRYPFRARGLEKEGLQVLSSPEAQVRRGG